METTIVYWGYRGRMEKNMEGSRQGIRFPKSWGLAFPERTPCMMYIH